MAIAYKASGTLAETETSGAALSPTCPATVDANDILVAHVVHLNITTTPATPSGWTLIYGPANLGTGTAVGRAWLFGKLAVGNEDGAAVAFGTTGGTSGRFARVRSFSGWVSGTLADVIPASQMSDIPSESAIPLPTVTTTIAGGLAVAFLVQDDNNALAAASGESGGSWTEPIADDVDTAIGAQGYVFGIQVCTPTADPGTVTGGTANATTDEGSSIGIEIRPSVPVVAPNEGDASGTIGWVGAATGTRTSAGAGSGAVSWVGSADGESPIVLPNDGTGDGTITWTGSATGITARSGSASGAVGWTGGAVGATTHSGASTGAVSWTGDASGQIDVAGAASGNITWAGSAVGEAPGVGPREGTANGTIGWAGSATGTAAHGGQGSGNLTWIGVASGVMVTQGSAAGAVSWTGTASGQLPSDRFWEPDPVPYLPDKVEYVPAPVLYVPLEP